jgi:hypothetical protein
MNLELFTLWLQHFHIHRSTGNVTLLLDVHGSHHINNEEALFCRGKRHAFVILTNLHHSLLSTRRQIVL